MKIDAMNGTSRSPRRVPVRPVEDGEFAPIVHFSEKTLP